MVEHFHRQLKATLAARSQPGDWIPLILLGIRTAFKVDISSTSAELVYGTTLQLPGEFFDSSSVACSPDLTDFVSQLKFHFQSFRPQPPRPTSHSSHVTDGLATATRVVVCCDGIRSLRVRVLSLWSNAMINSSFSVPTPSLSIR